MVELISDSKPSIWQSGWVNTLGRFAVLILVFGFFAWQVEDGKFYSPRNLESIARQSSVYATAALGMTLVVITAGIDLSVGSIIALSVIGVAWILNIKVGDEFLIDQYPRGLPIAAVMGSVLLAALAGLANGAMVVWLRITPFIVSLGTMGIFRGLAKRIANERDIYPEKDTWIGSIMDPTFVAWLNSGKEGTGEESEMAWMIFPPGIWLLLISAIGSIILLRYTRLGRHIYAVGSNEETARLCGVPVGRTKLIVYMLAGFFAGLAGLMQFSYIGGIGQPTTAISYELFVIAAVVIGGASLMGGKGTVLGSVIGAFMITILYMGGQQMDWRKCDQEMVIGGIIIGAVALDQIRDRGRS